MSARMLLFRILALAGLGLSAACGGGGAPVGAGEPEATNPPPTIATQPQATQVGSQSGEGAPTAESSTAGGVPADVPIYENPEDLTVTNDSSYISYIATIGVEDLKKWYQDQLLAMGWEQRNKADTGFGDSITLLRTKPGFNISVTIQSISGSEGSRVLITLIKTR